MEPPWDLSNNSYFHVLCMEETRNFRDSENDRFRSSSSVNSKLSVRSKMSLNGFENGRQTLFWTLWKCQKLLICVGGSPFHLWCSRSGCGKESASHHLCSDTINQQGPQSLSWFRAHSGTIVNTFVLCNIRMNHQMRASQWKHRLRILIVSLCSSISDRMTKTNVMWAKKHGCTTQFLV